MTEPLANIIARRTLEQAIAAAVREATETGMSSEDIGRVLAEYTGPALDIIRFLRNTGRRAA